MNKLARHDREARDVILKRENEQDERDNGFESRLSTLENFMGNQKSTNQYLKPFVKAE